MKKRNSFQKLKWRIAHDIWTRYSPSFDRLNRAPLLAEYVRANSATPTFADRELLYAYLNETVLKGAAIDYLEFGVHEGASLRAWTRTNKAAESRFYGFDSFEGLPEDWTDSIKKGAFDVGGKLPQLDDARVGLVKGWFQDTLPGFAAEFRPKNRLVVHNDADLFSSTLFTLTKLDSFLVPGTIVIFDEFADPMGEFRALEYYLQAYRREWKLVGVTRHFSQAAFEVI